MKILPLLIWGVADLFFILSVTVAILLGILLPSIQKELLLDSRQLGLLGFAFFLSFGLMQFITGSLVDSKGPKATLTCSALIGAIGFFLLSHANSFLFAMLSQVLIGIGFSIAYVGAIYLAEMWFSKEKFPLFSGITQMSAKGISSIALFSMALSGTILINFRDLTHQLGIITLCLALLLFVIIKKAPNHTKILKRSVFGVNLSKLLLIPQFWLGVVYFSTNFGMFLAFSSLWNIPDSLAYGHSLTTSTMLSATLRFGGAFGAVLSGILAHHAAKCSTMTKWYSSGALFLGALLIYGPVFPLPFIFTIMGLLGFFCGGTALGFPLVAQYIPAPLKGAGFGLMTSFGYLLSAFLEYLTGAILHSLNPSSTAISITEFKIALTPLIIVLLIGWCCSLKLKEKKL